MHFLITLTATAMIVVGAFYSYESSEEIKRVVATMEATAKNEVQGEKKESSEGETDPQEIITNSTPTSTASPPTPTSQLFTLTPTIAYFNNNLDDYRYPDATIKERSQNWLLLETEENVDTVTNWYKEKINDLGMSVTNFVVTKTNDVTKNVLTGGTSGEVVEVVISQTNENALVQIRVENQLTR